MPHAAHSLGIAVALAFAATTVSAMTSPAGSAARCEVSNADKLPAASGGGAALCAAIERAVASRGLGRTFLVRVVVGKRSKLTANITLADGRILPSLHMAQMDRPIGRTTLEQFGGAVADQIASAMR